MMSLPSFLTVIAIGSGLLFVDAGHSIIGGLLIFAGVTALTSGR